MIAAREPGLFERLSNRWRHSLTKWRATKELEACPSSEVRRIASDMGLTESELRGACRDQTGTPELLLQRLQVLGIDPEYVRHAEPATFRDLSRVCASCEASRRCARDLARGDVEAGMTSYCFNSPTLDALMVRADR
jgi:hypothetical protein